MAQSRLLCLQETRQSAGCWSGGGALCVVSSQCAFIGTLCTCICTCNFSFKGSALLTVQVHDHHTCYAGSSSGHIAGHKLFLDWQQKLKELCDLKDLIINNGHREKQLRLTCLNGQLSIGVDKVLASCAQRWDLPYLSSLHAHTVYRELNAWVFKLTQNAKYGESISFYAAEGKPYIWIQLAVSTQNARSAWITPIVLFAK